MQNLADGKCVPCRKTEPALTGPEIVDLHARLPLWEVAQVDGIPQLRRDFKFKNFLEAVAFANRVASIAEEEGHHPVLVVEWGKVSVRWWTHVIKGLHHNDFVMAAKTETLFSY